MNIIIFDMLTEMHVKNQPSGHDAVDYGKLPHLNHNFPIRNTVCSNFTASKQMKNTCWSDLSAGDTRLIKKVLFLIKL